MAESACAVKSCARGKYLIRRAHKASIDIDALHITALLPFIGKRPLRQIHDATLQPFKPSAAGTGSVKQPSMKRALEVVRRILNLAARSWRDEYGLTWLETAPLITMPDTRTTARKPYPLSWDEHRRLFALLPGSVARCGSERGKRAWRSLNKPRFGGVFLPATA
jgi:hypothetical protein